MLLPSLPKPSTCDVDAHHSHLAYIATQSALGGGAGQLCKKRDHVTDLGGGRKEKQNYYSENLRTDKGVFVSTRGSLKTDNRSHERAHKLKLSGPAK